MKKGFFAFKDTNRTFSQKKAYLNVGPHGDYAGLPCVAQSVLYFEKGREEDPRRCNIFAVLGKNPHMLLVDRDSEEFMVIHVVGSKCSRKRAKKWANQDRIHRVLNPTKKGWEWKKIYEEVEEITS